jgi:hypothetical protein
MVVGLISFCGMFLSFPELNPFLSILIKSLSVVVLFLLGSFFLGTGKEEWDWIKKRVKKSGP